MSAFIAGCEWTFGGSANNWQALNVNVDFSGTYKASDGGVLVRKYGSSGTTTNTTYTTNSVAGEVLATGDGSTTAFSGILANPVTLIKGTLTIVVGGYTCTDPGTASAGTVSLKISPSDGSTGTININNGAWTLTFPAAIANGTQFLAAYQYISSSSVTNSNQGNHGDPIYSMVLYQLGNSFKIMDNCNSTYEGKIGDVATNTTTAVAQFSVNGASQGYNVTIAGTLQGTYSSGGLSARTMTATFIEDGGYDAGISGTAQ